MAGKEFYPWAKFEKNGDEVSLQVIEGIGLGWGGNSANPTIEAKVTRLAQNFIQLKREVDDLKAKEQQT